MSEEKTIMIKLPLKYGEPLGVTPDEKLVIVQIQPKTVADGKLKINDKILSINKIKPRDRNHFYQLLRSSHSPAHLEVIRKSIDINSNENEILKQNLKLSNCEKSMENRSGYVYKLIRIDIIKGMRLGLGIRDISDRVYVSKVDLGSLVEGKLEIRDHIIDVEGTRVTNKDVTKELLIITMRAKGYFTCLIERPVSENAKKSIDNELQVQTDFSIIKLSDDVCEIAQQQRKREIELSKAALLGQAPIRPSVLIEKISTPKERPRVYFKDEDNKCFTIGNDNKGKILRPVRK